MGESNKKKKNIRSTLIAQLPYQLRLVKSRSNSFLILKLEKVSLKKLINTKQNHKFIFKFKYIIIFLPETHIIIKIKIRK